MLRLKFKDKILLIIFFILLLTSLWGKNIYLLVLFSLATYILIPLRHYWDNTSLLLLIFSLLYAMMVVMGNQVGSGFILISYIISPVAFYRFGRWLMHMFYEDSIRQKLFFVVILCYLLSLFVMTIKDTALVGVVNVSRVLLGEHGDADTLAATLYGLMASVGIGAIACILAKGQQLWLKCGFLFLSLMSLFVVIHLVNRTGIVIFACCLLVSFLIATKMKISRVIPTLIILCCVGFFIAYSGIVDEDILNAYQQREMSSSSNAVELGGRSAIWADAVRKLVTHPLGWSRVRYAHNLWLDIARVGGWLSLFVFLIPSIMWVHQCFRLARKNISPFILLLLSINVSVFLAAFVEPVIDGSMLFFSLMMMIWGCTASVSKEKSYEYSSLRFYQ